MTSTRYWVSWIQPTEDYRPLTDPPTEAILGWWCSGYDPDDNATLCAVVLAKTENLAKQAVKVDWPEAMTWRFCDRKNGEFEPGDRFPLNGWSKERMALRDRGAPSQEGQKK